MAAFNGLCEEFSAEKIITLLYNRLASRLEKTSYVEAPEGLFERFSVDQIVKFMSNILAVKSRTCGSTAKCFYSMLPLSLGIRDSLDIRDLFAHSIHNFVTYFAAMKLMAQQ